MRILLSHKNSWQAIRSIKNPGIGVSLWQKFNDISFQISDNGAKVEDNLLE